MTVVAIAPAEDASRGCCDTRSVLWNQVCNDMAHEDLTRAAMAVDNDPAVQLRGLVVPTGRADRALA